MYPVKLRFHYLELQALSEGTFGTNMEEEVFLPWNNLFLRATDPEWNMLVFLLEKP